MIQGGRRGKIHEGQRLKVVPSVSRHLTDFTALAEPGQGRESGLQSSGVACEPR